MQTFIVNRTENEDITEAIDQALVRTFKDVDSAKNALDSGLLKTGEIVATIEDGQGLETPEEQLRRLELALGSIENIIPLTASVNNLLTSVSDVEERIEALDVGDIDERVTNNTAAITAETDRATTAEEAIVAVINGLDLASVGGDGKYISSISQTDGQVSVTEGNIDTAPTSASTSLVTSGGVYSALDNETSRATTAESGLSSRVADIEADYLTSQDKTSLQASINSLTSRVTALESALNNYILKSGLTWSLSGTELSITKGY